MAITSVPGTGVDWVAPEELSDRVATSFVSVENNDGETAEGVQFTIGAPVTDFVSKQGENDTTLYTGAKISNGKWVIRNTPPQTLEESGASARAGDESTLIFQNKVVEDSTIKAKNKIALNLEIDSKFRRTSFTAANGKQSDDVHVDSSAKLINAEFNLKKGDDTFTLTGGATLKKTTTVDLGKKGADTVVIGDDIKAAKKAKLVIENMDKKDTLVVGGEEITLKQINKGQADLPGFLELG